MPDGRYSKAIAETQPDSFPPPIRDIRPPRERAVSLPDPTAPTTVSVSGANWRVTVPVALIVAAAGFFSGRQTAPASVDAQQLTTIQAETRADVAEIKRDVQALRESIAQRDNATQNRITVLEARIATTKP